MHSQLKAFSHDIEKGEPLSLNVAFLDDDACSSLPDIDEEEEYCRSATTVWPDSRVGRKIPAWALKEQVQSAPVGNRWGKEDYTEVISTCPESSEEGTVLACPS